MTGIHTRRPKPHRYEHGPTPGVCRWCPLPEANKEVHGEQAVAAAETQRQGWLAEEARRQGERA